MLASCFQVVQAAQATVLDLAALVEPAVQEHQLLPALDRLLTFPEQETRAATTQLFAHLGHAVPPQLTEDGLLPRVLAQAGDMDFQVRRVCIYQQHALAVYSEKLLVAVHTHYQ